jgi:hypothetical protein
MRIITDSTGTQWTVFEVKRQGGRSTTDRWSYLPPEFGDGWLCFESPASKRRLTPVPEHWREATDAELTRLLGEAQTVNRPNYTLDDRPDARE